MCEGSTEQEEEQVGRVYILRDITWVDIFGPLAGRTNHGDNPDEVICPAGTICQYTDATEDDAFVLLPGQEHGWYLTNDLFFFMRD